MKHKRSALRTLDLARRRHWHTAALALGLLSAASTTSAAPTGSVEAAFVARHQTARSFRDVRWASPSGPGVAGFAGWTAMLDHDTDVPLRLWGPSVSVPGAMADGRIAEAWARRFLAAHLDVLAPGASPADFAVVANELSPSGELRSVGFEQRAGGIRVLGGTISFAFKNDRMILIGSTALPHVTVARPGARLADHRVTAAATSWLDGDGHATAARGAVAADRVIVPVVRPRRGSVDIAYTLAEQVTMQSTTDEGRWRVYVDAATGVAFARTSEIMYATGTVQFDVPRRAPMAAAGRRAEPAALDVHRINGDSVTSDAGGVVTWTGASPASVVPGLAGPRVAITNRSGALATTTLTLGDGGTSTWSRADDELEDAQLSSFVYANQVKAFAKARLNPGLAYLDQPLPVFVNETQTCNAFSTGDDLHFFVKSAQCENTGRIADVVYHEFGHSLHVHSIIPGVGAFDIAMSEGASDTLAASITGDSGVGRGLFLSDAPLRELDPPVKKRWPDDVNGEPHHDGEIYGEAMWDLRHGLEAALGSNAGFTLFLQLYYATLQRASDIPSSYAEVLAADDDDGDLSNGTPHECLINTAFGAHGLVNTAATVHVEPPTRDHFAISLQATPGGNAACPATVQSAKIDWRVRGGSFTQLGMSVDGSTYAATLPTQLDGAVLEYSVTVELSDGGHVRFPDNAADYYYQAYVGEVSRLWCADFEGGFAGWTHSTTPSEADEWEVGTPAGRGGDPSSAHGGVGALGIDLTHDGQYAAEMTTAVESPTIDLAGHTTGVHLQYYRWLRAEDGFFDRSTVRANGAEIWRSFASFRSADAQVHHLDKEWRFHDLDVSAQAAAGTIKLQFGLTSDGGLQAGGWTIDDVCLVVPAPPGPACGNGTVETGESCDDGNTTAGDGCAASCQTEPAGGDGGGGCSSTSSAPTGGSALGLLALGLIMPSARRRRHGGTGAPGTGRRPHRRGWRRPPHVLARDPASADTRAPCS